MTEKMPFGPLPEDRGLDEETINSAPQVQEAANIMRSAAKLNQSEDPAAFHEQRVFDLAQIPDLAQEALDRAEAVIAELESRPGFDEPGSEANIDYRSALKHRYELMSRYHELQAATNEQQKRELTNRLLDEQETLDLIASPVEANEPTRWPGTHVHQTSPAESAADSYIKRVEELSAADVKRADNEQSARLEELDPVVLKSLRSINPRLHAVGQLALSAGPESPIGRAYTNAQVAHEQLLQNFATYLDGKIDQEEILVDLARVNQALNEVERLTGE